MRQYKILVHVDDDFYIDPDTGQPENNQSIISTSGDYAQVDPNLLMDKSFFEPVKEIIKLGKDFKDISKKDLDDIMDNLSLKKSKYDCDERHTYFELDNPYDLYCASKLDDIRIDFGYKHCPVYDILLIDRDAYVEIHLSTFTKNYFTISSTEWWRFCEYLNKKLSKAEVRDGKIEEILGDVKPYKNLLRNLEFIVENGDSNRFFNSVLNFYREKGFISEKQAKAIMKSIW